MGLVGLLVEKYGVDVNEPSESRRDGNTALENAVLETSRREADNESPIEIVKYLIQRGARITPITLHYVDMYGRWELAQLLLREGADPCQAPQLGNLDGNELGTTVLHTAVIYKQDEFAKRLPKCMRQHNMES